MSGFFDFTGKMQEGVQNLGLSVEQEAFARLHIYFTELLRWSKKINLIARGSSERIIIENHFLDSLTLLPFLETSDVHLMDIGTGAGFPGLVCGAALPEMSLTLVEPRLKRVSFLRHIVRTLKLENVEIIAGRIEDVAPEITGIFYSHVTSRAVTNVGSFLDMVDPVVQPGTKILCMKGSKWQEETVDLDSLLQKKGLELKDKKLFQLPFSGATRALLLYGKK